MAVQRSVSPRYPSGGGGCCCCGGGRARTTSTRLEQARWRCGSDGERGRFNGGKYLFEVAADFMPMRRHKNIEGAIVIVVIAGLVRRHL